MVGSSVEPASGKRTETRTRSARDRTAQKAGSYSQPRVYARTHAFKTRDRPYCGRSGIAGSRAPSRRSLPSLLREPPPLRSSSPLRKPSPPRGHGGLR